MEEPEVKQPTPTPTDEPTPNPLLEKVLKEKKNAMERVRELENSLQDLTDKQLKEKEDWKTLYETTKTKLDSINGELETERVTKVNGFKLSSLKKELSKMGADEKSMDALLRLADIDKLKYDHEHRVVLGAEEIAKSIKDLLPREFGVSHLRVDQDAPNSTMKDLDIDSYKSLSYKEKRDPKILKAFYEKHGISVRD